LDQLDLGVRFVTQGRSTVGGIALGALLVAAAYQFVSGRGLPAGITLLNYAAASRAAQPQRNGRAVERC
jgi:hypothetical protein